MKATTRVFGHYGEKRPSQGVGVRSPQTEQRTLTSSSGLRVASLIVTPPPRQHTAWRRRSGDQDMVLLGLGLKRERPPRCVVAPGRAFSAVVGGWSGSRGFPRAAFSPAEDPPCEAAERTPDPQAAGVESRGGKGKRARRGETGESCTKCARCDATLVGVVNAMKSDRQQPVNPRPVIVVDTREQTPLPFLNLETVAGTLMSGDYSIAGFEPDFAIERKTPADLCPSVSGRDLPGIGCFGTTGARACSALLRLRLLRCLPLAAVGELHPSHLHPGIDRAFWRGVAAADYNRFSRR